MCAAGESTGEAHSWKMYACPFFVGGDEPERERKPRHTTKRRGVPSVFPGRILCPAHYSKCRSFTRWACYAAKRDRASPKATSKLLVAPSQNHEHKNWTRLQFAFSVSRGQKQGDWTSPKNLYRTRGTDLTQFVLYSKIHDNTSGGKVMSLYHKRWSHLSILFVSVAVLCLDAAGSFAQFRGTPGGFRGGFRGRHGGFQGGFQRGGGVQRRGGFQQGGFQNGGFQQGGIPNGLQGMRGRPPFLGGFQQDGFQQDGFQQGLQNGQQGLLPPPPPFQGQQQRVFQQGGFQQGRVQVNGLQQGVQGFQRGGQQQGLRPPFPPPPPFERGFQQGGIQGGLQQGAQQGNQ